MTVQILCGDCLELMRDLPDSSVDAVITDPPYEVNLSANECAWDVWPDGPYWQELARVLSADGVLAFTIAPHVAHERLLDVTPFFDVLEVGFWVYGAGRPVSKYRLKRCYDLVYFMSTRTRKLNIEGARGAFRSNSITGQTGTIQSRSGLGRQFHHCGQRRAYACGQKDYWPANVACNIGSDAFGDSRYELIFAVKRSPPIGRTNERHPTQKPLDLVAQIVKLASVPGATVLDPWMGSGTTGVAAVSLGRSFIGMEKETKWVATAQQRIAEAQMQPTLFEEAAE